MIETYKHIKVIGFDADDTLWVNETYFRDAEKEFCNLLSKYNTPKKLDKDLFKMEISNLPLYGYGVKAFTLSMVECALEVSNYNVSAQIIEKILNIGKSMLNQPIELLDDVKDVLHSLSKSYKLILVTKGDLLDQECKIKKSGLSSYFHHVEVLSDKKEANYLSLLNQLDITPSEYLMVGNSLKSDVLPIINIKSHAIHIPFHTTWVHEEVTEDEKKGKSYKTLNNLRELLSLLN